MPDRTVCTDDKGCASATVCVVTLRAAQPCGTLATPWLAGGERPTESSYPFAQRFGAPEDKFHGREGPCVATRLTGGFPGRHERSHR